MKRRPKSSWTSVVVTVAGMAAAGALPAALAQPPRPPTNPPSPTAPPTHRLRPPERILRNAHGTCAHDSMPCSHPHPGVSCNPPRPRPVVCPAMLTEEGTLTARRGGRCRLVMTNVARTIRCPEYVYTDDANRFPDL